MRTGIIARLVIATFFPLLVSAEDFRISFLDEPLVLDQTCASLETNGFPKDTVRIFRILAQWQNEGGNGVDVSKFPERKNGGYLFHGLADFTNRITRCFAHAEGKPTFMCFDAALLLLHSAGSGADRTRESLETKSFVNVTPERDQGPISRASLLTATNILCPPEGYRQMVGRERSEAETLLGVSLHAARRLGTNITDSDSGLRTAFAEFLRDVKRDGFTFPTNCRLGLVYYVDVKRRFIKTDHAFLCLPRDGCLTILEKDNSTGPYVRGDFASEEDLAQYASFPERTDTNNPKDVDYGSSVIVSLNERLIGVFRPNIEKHEIR